MLDPALMPPPTISDDAILIKTLNQKIGNVIREKALAMDGDINRQVLRVFMDTIKEIGDVIERPTVRGHDDPDLQFPVVHEGSSWFTAMTRLRHQTKVARKLADLLHAGPPENDDETETLNKVKHTLRETYQKVYLATTHCKYPAGFSRYPV